MKLTHLGHACVLVETDRARILIDPGNASSFEGVADLDAVLVTHQHPDHIDAPKVAALLAANPSARFYIDPDSAHAVDGLPEGWAIARTGDRIDIGGTTVDVVGGLHAAVYGDVPGCTNSAYIVDDGAFFHPGDSLHVPDRPIDVLAVAVSGPWIKVAESVDHVKAVAPRVAVPIHEGAAANPAFIIGMVSAFAGDDIVRRLDRGTATEV